MRTRSLTYRIKNNIIGLTAFGKILFRPIYSSDGELVAISMMVGEWPLENHHGMISDEISLTEDLLKERARDYKKEGSIGKKRVADD